MRPMLAESVDPASVDFYINDENWVSQQKLDGDRILICAGDDGVRALNRQGEPRRNAVPRKVLRQFENMPGAWCFDGELLNGELWLFDMPEACGHVTPESPLAYRLGVLERLFAGWNPDPCIRLLPTARTAAEKKRLLTQVQTVGGEGVMFKHRDSKYRSGRRSRQMLKAKFTKTCDAVVTAIGVDGKTNCHYSMFDNGHLVEVGSCSLQGKPPVALGDVIELTYLYASEDRKLYQPRMMRVRHDKSAVECTIDQLEFTNRTVLQLRVPPGAVRQRRRSRRFRVTVEIHDTHHPQAELARDEGGRWATICVDHNTLVHHQSLALARHFAPFPDNWCEICAGTPERPSR